MATGYEPAKAYHAYTALFYWVGIAGVSRGAAWLAAGATAWLSPSYLLLKDFRADGTGLRGCRARLRQPSWWPRLLSTTVYLRHARSLFPVTPDYQSRVEYRISDWLAKNLPKCARDGHRLGAVLVRRPAGLGASGRRLRRIRWRSTHTGRIR